jgi:hypothetical protein
VQRITEDQGRVLQRLLHPKFFRQAAKPDYPSVAARSSIAVLLGFLRGCLAEAKIEAQREANAREYAEEKPPRGARDRVRPSAGLTGAVTTA